MRVEVNMTRFQKALYYMARFIGLSPFIMKDNEIHPVTFLGKAYSLVLAAATFSWVWMITTRIPDKVGTGSSMNLVSWILVYFFNASIISALYIFSFKSEKIVDVMERIIAAENDLKRLEIRKNQEANTDTIPAKIIATNILILGLKISEFLYDPVNHFTGIWYGTFWIGVILLMLNNTSTILIFVQTMNRIGKCFESLNDQLWDVPRPDSTVLSSDNLGHSPIAVLNVQDRDSQDVRIFLERIRKMRKLHRELSGLVNSTTDIFTAPIILTIGYLFSSSLVCCYIVYESIVSLKSLPNTTMTLKSVFTQTMPPAMVIVIEAMLIANACTWTCNTGNATKIVIHRVWNKFHPEALRRELFVFSVQLLNNPVVASAFGFFDLGYSFVHEMFCAVVAYLVIMIQLDTSSSRKTAA